MGRGTDLYSYKDATASGPLKDNVMFKPAGVWRPKARGALSCRLLRPHLQRRQRRLQEAEGMYVAVCMWICQSRCQSG